MQKTWVRRSTTVAGALILSAALSPFFAACAQQPKSIVMDDFESGALANWKAVGSGSGGWFVYTNGKKAPDPAQSDPNFPFDLPDPPQGKFAAVTDMKGPGTRIRIPEAPATSSVRSSRRTV